MTKMTENQMKVRLHKIISENSEFTTWTVSTPHIMLLVKQAIEEEREACAQLVEDFELVYPGLSRCGNAIRARGQA